MTHEHKNLLHVGARPCISITEWIPFGTNNLVLLEEKLEAYEERGECLLTAVIDEDPETTTVELDEPETKVKPVAGDVGEWIAFTADVNYAATGADNQIERFTTRVDSAGSVTCELELLESNGNVDRHSLDDLAKVVADLVEDSSTMMNTLLNNFQRRLLDLVYCDQSSQRDKYVMVTTDVLTPHEKSVEGYTENPATMAELSQIIGRPLRDHACVLSDKTLLIPGTSGAVFVTKDADAYRRVIEPCCFFLGIQSFLTNTFSRMWMTWDRLSQVKDMIRTDGIRRIMEIQDVISELSGDISMFESILAYVERSASSAHERLNAVRSKPTRKESELIKALKIGNQVERIRSRVDDAHLIVDGLEKEAAAVRDLAQTLGEKETYRISQFMNVLTIVSVIVLPLSLITGFYGMNFQAYEPAGEIVHPYNMPELYLPYGYLLVIGVMSLLALIQIVYFRRKGLLGHRE